METNFNKRTQCLTQNKVFTRIRQKYCSGTCLKFVYLACATLVSASIIIECILAHLVITPYISESVYESGVCLLYYTATGKRVKCENKCSKDRSAFPCAVVQVVYIPALVQEDQIPAVIEALRHRTPAVKEYLVVKEARLLYLYDYFSTYAAYKADKCSTSPCNRREADNVETVDQYLRELHATGLMPCYARPLHKKLSSRDVHSWKHRLNSTKQSVADFIGTFPDTNENEFIPFQTMDWLLKWTNSPLEETSYRQVFLLQTQGHLSAAALMHRLYPDTLLFHSLFWPIAIILCCLLLIGLAYVVDGCKVWRTDMTVIA
ncbi:unnamed protein product [Mesocestoides corti]|uniref:Transmembrane protein n=1 Tax=Mesocestoides corti TaxID=53468 RepID=A0A0R3U3C5_MESCO|nr:unnamed protein product [Mesocestoides corti]